MFVVRPIARDDLPAVLALSERTGTGLTTLPASRERLAERIDRSIASFAGTAPREDACYVFVLTEAARGAARELAHHVIAVHEQTLDPIGNDVGVSRRTHEAVAAIVDPLAILLRVAHDDRDATGH